MIKVTRTDSAITVQGHANYAPIGKDIVCAGTTALIQTLIESMQELTTDNIQVSIEPGKAYIKYRDLSKAGKLLVDSFFIGINQIADEFPENLQII